MFTERLTQLLEARHISKTKMLSDLKMGKNQFRYWETKGVPNASTVQAIADYLSVSPSYLIGESDDLPPDVVLDAKNYDYIPINKTLKILMAERHITWSELSSILNIGKNQLNYWTVNNTLPDGKTLIKLSQFFGVSTDYLLGLADDNSPVISAQEKTLLAMFRETSEEGRFRIIQAVMNIRDEVEKKRIATPDQSVAG